LSGLPEFLTKVFYQVRPNGLIVRHVFNQTFHLVQRADEVAQIKRMVTVFYSVMLADIMGSLALFFTIMTVDSFAKDLGLVIIMVIMMLSGFIWFSWVLAQRLKTILEKAPLISPDSHNL